MSRMQSLIRAMRTPWTVVVILLCGILVTWLAKATGAKFTSPQDPLALATTFAAILGGMFVVGGLVVALAAVVTLVDIDSRIKGHVDALMPSILDDAAKQAKAFMLQTSMIGAKPWKSAINDAEKAIALYRAISDVRADVALRLMAERCRHAVAAMGAREGRLRDRDYPSHTEITKWLYAAIEFGDDHDRCCIAALALIDALDGNWGAVTQRFAQLPIFRERSATLREYLQEPKHVAIYAIACEGRSDRLTQLGELIGRRLPLEDAFVRPIILNKEETDISKEAFRHARADRVPPATTILHTSSPTELYVLAKSSLSPTTTSNVRPSVLYIECRASADGSDVRANIEPPFQGTRSAWDPANSVITTMFDQFVVLTCR